MPRFRATFPNVCGTIDVRPTRARGTDRTAEAPNRAELTNGRIGMVDIFDFGWGVSVSHGGRFTPPAQGEVIEPDTVDRFLWVNKDGGVDFVEIDHKQNEED